MSTMKNVQYHKEVMEKLRLNAIMTKEDREYICNLLNQRFKKRKRESLDGNVPEIQGDSATTETALQRTHFGCQVDMEENIPEDQPIDKDLDEDIHYVNNLKEQFKLSIEERDHVKIKKNLDITFKSRRQYITIDKRSVSEIKEIYPILFEREQILEEFKRITHMDIVSSFYGNLSKYKDVIFESSRTSGQIYALIEKQRCILDGASQEYKTYFELFSALLLLPTLLNEDFCHIVQYNTQKKRKTQIPCIVCSAPSLEELLQSLWNKKEYKILIEDITVCCTSDFIDVFLLYLASLYIFDTKFPTKCEKTLNLIDSLFLNNQIDESLIYVVDLREAFSRW